MKVILLEKIAHLGNLGDMVTVKDGFGRNYLIPSKRAVPANQRNIVEFEARRAELERKAQQQLTTAQTCATKLEALQAVTLHCQVSDEGKLYGSVSAKDIAHAIAKQDIDLEVRHIILPSEAKRGIRHIGQYEVTIALHVDVITKLMVNVVAEK